MGTPTSLAPAQCGDPIHQVSGLPAGSYQVVREGNVNRAPTRGAEEHQHPVPPPFPERIRDPAQLGPSSERVSATVSSTPPTLETSPATWNPPPILAASANRASRRSRSSSSCSTRRTRCSG